MRFPLTLLTAGLVGNLLLIAPLPAADFSGSEEGNVVLAESGRIDAVNMKDRYLIVDDSRYALAPDVVIRSSSGASVPLSSLKRGMRIAFAVQAGSGAGARTVTDLVIRSNK